MREVYELHADLCKVFSNHIRLEVLDLLRNGEMSVMELVEETRLSQANVSQHLAIMRQKGIVKARRRGKNIYYKLANPKIIKAFDIIKEVLTERLTKNRKIVDGF